MDLQLPMQSVPITTNVVSLNPTHGEEFSIQHYVIKVCRWIVTGLFFSLCTLVSCTNKTDCHDITEILLKMALNNITPPPPPPPPPNLCMKRYDFTGIYLLVSESWTVAVLSLFLLFQRDQNPPSVAGIYTKVISYKS